MSAPIDHIRIFDTTLRDGEQAPGCSIDGQFSPEDATRSEVGFLHEVLHEAIAAGATTLNIPDTVGYTKPEEYHALIAGIREQVVQGRDVVIATHCHDDLGLAVDNSLSGVRAGARQVECTVNGIGERAGNAALEEVVMALRTRADRFQASTRIATTEIGRTSRLVARHTGMRVPADKAIVGANAFAHEAGIHQDGMLKHRDAYEIMRADEVGLDGGGLVLGKHSGRAALRAHLASLGHVLEDDACNAVFARFKDVADRKKVVDDRELEAIVAGVSPHATLTRRLDLLQVSSGTRAIPTATAKLISPDGSTRIAAAEGDGPVDAACRAIDACIEHPTGELVEFHVDAAAEGINAVGSVRVTLRASDVPVQAHGFSVHTDIIVATAEAYVAAINALARVRARHRQATEAAA